MGCNDSYFVPPTRDETFLRARGFDKQGQRSGGIIKPLLVSLPTGAFLIRLFHDEAKAVGEWWSTPHELVVIGDYFARSGPAFGEGRSRGKGILHATLAVRHDWGGNSADHLARFIVVRLTERLTAYHGEGDHAPDATQRQVQKAVTITDGSGRQRGARQVFLPKAWEYPKALMRVHEGTSDLDLLETARRFDRGALSFEG